MRVLYVKIGCFNLWLFLRMSSCLFLTAVNSDLVCASISTWPVKKKYRTNCVVFLLDENSEIPLDSQFPENSGSLSKLLFGVSVFT